MNPTSSTPLQKAIEAVEGLPIEDQDIIHFIISVDRMNLEYPGTPSILVLYQ